ncbi:MAG: hypothetical protein GZ091_15645 [Paludibacter sp.]|nr:hypothetical protein [Paludibacter sp.]
MKIKSFVIAALISITIVIPMKAKSSKNLDKKDAFTIGFPQFYAFRGEMNRKTQINYEAWSNEIENSNGVIRKLLDEEILINPVTTNWANTFAQENPTKLMLLHLNGEARHVIRNPEVLKKYFPGHWLYEEGSVLNQNIKTNDKDIIVKNIEPFINRKYRGGNGEGSNFSKNDIPNYVLLVKLDEKGNRLWYESEIIQITNVDKNTNTLSVSRGICNTKPISFEAGKTYLAPILGGVWGGGVMFFYNLSIDCPKDKNGKTASDLRVDEIAQEFSKKGVLENINGIAFDVNYFDVSDRFPTCDTNNDGKKDGGWINNENHWKLGDYLFLKNLRSRMGDDFIITADGQHAENQQAVGVLNGIESEGLVQHNDAWRGFSRAVNTHQYWEHNNNTKYQFRYVVLKLMNKTDAENSVRLQRFGIATACCLGAFTTDPSLSGINKNSSAGKGMLPEWMTKSGALGKSSAELIHYSKQFPDIFSKTSEQIKNLISSEDCNIKIVNGQLEVSPKNKQSKGRDMNFTIKNIDIPSGDITIFIEAKSIDPSDGLSFADRVPRMMWLTMSNLPDYGEGKNVNQMYNHLSGQFGTNRMEEMSFYFRRNNDAEKKNDISIQIQGKGKISINSIKIYNKADILIRKFEYGVVIVNPSFVDQMIDLSNYGIKMNELKVSSIDGEFIKY